MSVPDVLHGLLTAAGPSGYEQAPAAVFRDACAPFADVVSDTVGSTVARVRGSGEGPVLAVVGHIDEIGLIVTHVDDEGFLWFTRAIEEPMTSTDTSANPSAAARHAAAGAVS